MILEIKNLKFLITKIIWLDSYQVLILDEDYSVYFIQFSPKEIGLSL